MFDKDIDALIHNVVNEELIKYNNVFKVYVFLILFLIYTGFHVLKIYKYIILQNNFIRLVWNLFNKGFKMSPT